MSTLVLKHWFIPHHGNRHQPNILRLPVLLAISTGLLVLQLAYNFSVSGQWRVLSYASDIDTNAITELTNDERGRAGLAQLRRSPTLDAAAAAKARDMFAKDYWSHIAPDGSEPWVFFHNAGYTYLSAGENLAKDFDTSSGVMAGWMNSPGHKANVLSDKYTDVGVAVMDGELSGQRTTLVVAFYGSQLKPDLGPRDSPNASVQSVQTDELAPSARNYSAASPLLFTQTLGWGPLATVGTMAGLVPVYVMTHLNMIRHRLHRAARGLWRRRIIETALLLSLIGAVLLGSWGAVG